MKLHVMEHEIRLPISIGQAWDFFSDPRNLERITPADMAFKVTSRLPDRVYPGLIITYTMRPLFKVPVQWVTEITHVAEPHLFVDEQRFGPYRFWHHQHLFREIPGGVACRDIVHYALPKRARPVRPFLITPRLQVIFDHRRRVLEELFGVYREPQPDRLNP
ncbi:MAG TPA: SRPBCC family protein [Longimicrobium sp.]|nr:SRPBCC family protein [Longimicrobium sp.]